MEDAELTEIARQLYARHKEAFDFVFKIRPQRDDLLEPLRILVDENPSLCLDRPSPGVIRFAHKDWAQHNELNSCPPQQWTKSRRNLLFELRAYGDSPRISISLILGPGEDSLRNHIYSEASKRPAVFLGLVKPMGQRTSAIYVRDLRSGRAANDANDTEREKALESSWRDFAEGDLLSLNAAIEEAVGTYHAHKSQTTGGAAQ